MRRRVGVVLQRESWQIYSNISPPLIQEDGVFSVIVQRPDQGAVYAPGSSMVYSYESVFRFGREIRSVMCSCSVVGKDPATHCFSLKPTLSITSVSPSQCPTEWPKKVGRRSSPAGWGRPSK